MKKLLISFSLLTCCFILWMSAPVFAQTQSSCFPGTPYYQDQPYSPPQPSYIQPPVLPHLPPQAQPSYYPPQPQPQPQWGTGYWYNPKQMYQYGLSLVYAKRYNEAIQIFQQFLRCYPQSSLADNALYWLGECYYVQKCYSTALWHFQCILSQYPRGNKVPDAMLKIALSYFSMKQNERGCQMLNELLQRYPKSEPAQKAYRWLNRCGWSSGEGTYPPCPPPGYVYPYSYYGDSTFPRNY